MTNFPPNRWLRQDPETRKAEDLHTLRVLAKLVSEDRYRLERLRPERLHKTQITIQTYIWHVEVPDWDKADVAVRAAEARRALREANGSAAHR